MASELLMDAWYYGLYNYPDTYEVFVRDWWRYDANGQLVPYPGAPETRLGYAADEEQAREACRRYNEMNEPGELSRKAEYRSL